MNYAGINVITHVHKLFARQAGSVFKSSVSYATHYTPNVARASRVNAPTRATVVLVYLLDCVAQLPRVLLI